MISGILIAFVLLIGGVLGTGTQTFLALPGQALLAVTALLSVANRSGSLNWKVLVPGIVAYVYLVLRAHWSEVAYLAHADFFLGLGGLIALCLGFLNGVRASFRLGVMTGLAVLVVLNVVVGLVHLKDPSLSVLPGYSRAFPGTRIGGLYTNPNHLCSFAALILPILIGAFFVYRGRLLPLCFFGVLGLGLGAVAILSLSRAGVVGLGASAVLFVIFLVRSKMWQLKIRIPWWLVVGGAVAACVALVVGIQLVNKRSDELFDTLGQRQQLASTAFRQVEESPVVGTGAGSFRYLSNLYRPSNWKAHVQDHAPEFAHNDWIQLAAEYGIAGVLLAGAAIAFFYWMVWQWLGERDRSIAARDVVFVAGAAAGIGGVFVHSFFDFNLHVWSHVLLVSLFLGVVLRVITEVSAEPWKQTTRWNVGRWAVTGVMFLTSVWVVIQWDIWKAEQLGTAGLRAASKGEYTVSNGYLSQSLEHEPGNGTYLASRAANYLGMAYRYRSRAEVKKSYELKALTDFERFSEINPRSFQGWLSQGLVLTELKRFDAAEHRFERALTLAPFHRVVHFGCASFLFAKAVSNQDLAIAKEARDKLSAVFPRFGSTPASLELFQRIDSYIKERER